MQQAGGTALHQAVHIAALGDESQRCRPLIPSSVVVGECQRCLHAGEALDHRCRCVVVERATRNERTGHHSDHEPVEHPSQRRRIGAAHVAVPKGSRQRAEGIDHLHDIGVVRGLRLDSRHHWLDDVGKVGQQRNVEDLHQVGQRCRRGGTLQQAVGGSGQHGGAVGGQLDHANRQLGLPPQGPGLTKGAATAPALLHHTPRHAQRSQPVEQQRTGPAVRSTHVEFHCLRIGRRLEAHPALLRSQVAGKGDLRRFVGYLADGITDDQLAMDERQPGTARHHRVGSIEHFGEAGARALPQGGECTRRARGRDEVVGRGRNAALAQQPGGTHEPAADTFRPRVTEHVRVPPGAAHTGAVAGGGREATMRPRHPADTDLHLGEAAQRVGVDRGSRQGLAERGDVPRTADDGDSLMAIGDRTAQHLAHVRLALRFTRRCGFPATTYRQHRLRHGVERRHAIAAVLDDVVPPALGVGVAGCRRQCSQRIAHRMVRKLELARAIAFADRGPGQRDGERQIHRPDRHFVSPGPNERLPLGAELGERQEHSALRLVDHVAEQGHRRHQLLVSHPVDGGFAVGR